MLILFFYRIIPLYIIWYYSCSEFEKIKNLILILQIKQYIGTCLYTYINTYNKIQYPRSSSHLSMEYKYLIQYKRSDLYVYILLFSFYRHVIIFCQSELRLFVILLIIIFNFSTYQSLFMERLIYSIFFLFHINVFITGNN